MVIASNEISFAREVADRIVYMDQGRIVEEGTPADLFNQPKQGRTRQYLYHLQQ